MKTSKAIQVFGCAFLDMFLLSGCIFPMWRKSYSEISAIYSRVDQNNVTNEVITVMHSGAYWVGAGPSGPEALGDGNRDKTYYYFSGRHIRQRSLSFLNAEDNSQWQLFAAVQATNRWVRVQGWFGQPSIHANGLVITVFTPREILYQQAIPTTESSLQFVSFLEGNRVVRYKSKSDDFTYAVLDNRLMMSK
jgi:hypothetical protein